MEWIERSIQWMKATLSISIFRIGEFDLTLWSLFYIIFLIWLLMVLSGKLKRWIAEGVLGTSAMEVSRREAIGSITRYVVVTVTENVVNWSHNDDSVRLKIPVQVAYGSDVRLVERLLLEVASENSDVLKSPAPTLFPCISPRKSFLREKK